MPAPSPPRRRDGDATESSRLVTSYDVARHAGVSQSAVSRCFSPGGSISARTRAKVERAAASLGYVPNALARSLITRKSGLVGLVVTDTTFRYSPQIVHDLSDALESIRLLPLLIGLRDETSVATALLRVLDYQPEAILSLATPDAASIETAAARGVAFIAINRDAPGTVAVAIKCDHGEAIGRLVCGLMDCDHRRLAFIAGPAGAPVSEERLSGFRAALAQRRMQPAAVVYADYTYEGGHRAALDLMTRKLQIDAIVAANDAMAIGALDACRFDLGLDVPGRISITGFDDIAEASRPSRDLTTVRQPTAAMAALAVETIAGWDRSGRNGPQGSVHLIPGTPIVRGTARLPWKAMGLS